MCLVYLKKLVEGFCPSLVVMVTCVELRGYLKHTVTPFSLFLTCIKFKHHPVSYADCSA